MEGLEKLQGINATVEEVTRAVTVLKEGGYNYKDPGSTFKTIINSRSEKKSEFQQLGGGQLVT